jgi:hypothetical protein
MSSLDLCSKLAELSNGEMTKVITDIISRRYISDKFCHFSINQISKFRTQIKRTHVLYFKFYYYFNFCFHVSFPLFYVFIFY